MKKIFLLSIVIFITMSTFGQQLPQFSQYIFNGLHINPAYAGYKNEGYIQSTYRNQWIGFEGAPKTFTLTADFSSNEGTMGFGASILSDRIGPTNTTTTLFTYAYRIQTGKESFFSLGASGGVSQYIINGDMLLPLHPNDPNIPTGMLNMTTPNMNLGAFFHNNSFYLGFSAFNLIGEASLEREDIALSYHDTHFYLTGGVLLPIRHNIQFKPSFLVREVRGAPTNYDLNGMLLFMDRLWVGVSYRSNINIWKENLDPNLSNRNTVAFITELYATKNIRFGYAYDQNINILADIKTNSHELSIGYYISSRRASMKNSRYF